MDSVLDSIENLTISKQTFNLNFIVDSYCKLPYNPQRTCLISNISNLLKKLIFSIDHSEINKNIHDIIEHDHIVNLIRTDIQCLILNVNYDSWCHQDLLEQINVQLSNDLNQLILEMYLQK